MKVIITIPAFNEGKTIEKTISEIHHIMKNTPYDYKVLVLNDGSTDNTVEIAKKNGALVVSNKRNLGLAETFKREMEECLNLGADIIVHTDADGQYPASYIPEMIKKVKEGNDLVLGSRFGKGKYSGSFMKKIGNMAFSHVFTSLLRTKITDTTTGFRAFTAEVAKLPIINTFTYTQEQIIRAGKSNMLLGEVPIHTNQTRPSRLFNSSFDYAVKAWVNILRIYRDYEPIKFFGLFGSVFFGIGFLVGLYILFSFIKTGLVGAIPRVMLSVLFISIGVQIWLFGFLADTLRK